VKLKTLFNDTDGPQSDGSVSESMKEHGKDSIASIGFWRRWLNILAKHWEKKVSEPKWSVGVEAPPNGANPWSILPTPSPIDNNCYLNKYNSPIFLREKWFSENNVTIYKCKEKRK